MCDIAGTNAYSEIVVETVSQNDNEKETEKVSKTSKSTKDNSKTAKPAIARRSRIKPNITPVTRKRNTPKTKTAIKNDLDNADGDQHSNETADTNGRLWLFSLNTKILIIMAAKTLNFIVQPSDRAL